MLEKKMRKTIEKVRPNLGDDPTSFFHFKNKGKTNQLTQHTSCFLDVYANFLLTSHDLLF